VFVDLGVVLGVGIFEGFVWAVYCLCSFVSPSRWDVLIVWFGKVGVQWWVLRGYVAFGMEPVE